MSTFITNRLYRFYVVLIMVLAFYPGLTRSASLAEEEAAIRKVGQEWLDAYRAGDIDRLMATYTDDAFLALAGQNALRGKKEVRAFFEPRIRSLSAQSVDVTMQFERLSVVGDMAYTITLNWITTKPENGLPTRIGARSIIVYRKLPGLGWKQDADIEQRTLDADVETIPQNDLN